MKMSTKSDRLGSKQERSLDQKITCHIMPHTKQQLQSKSLKELKAIYRGISADLSAIADKRKKSAWIEAILRVQVCQEAKDEEPLKSEEVVDGGFYIVHIQHTTSPWCVAKISTKGVEVVERFPTWGRAYRYSVCNKLRIANLNLQTSFASMEIENYA